MIKKFPLREVMTLVILVWGGVWVYSAFFKNEKIIPKGPIQGKIIYENKLYGYRLEIPNSWKGKYKVDEREGEVAFLYHHPFGSYPIFRISVFNQQSWKGAISEPGYHGNEIDRDGKSVFVYILPLENPYAESPHYQEEAEEFQRMVGESQQIIKTFRLLKK